MSENNSNLTCEDLEIAVRDLQNFFEEQKKLDLLLKAISPSNTGVVEFGNYFIDAYINVLEKSFGDNFNWISWFVFENDFGKKGMQAKASPDKKLVKIKTVKQLYRIINA